MNSTASRSSCLYCKCIWLTKELLWITGKQLSDLIGLDYVINKDICVMQLSDVSQYMYDPGKLLFTFKVLYNAKWPNETRNLGNITSLSVFLFLSLILSCSHTLCLFNTLHLFLLEWLWNTQQHYQRFIHRRGLWKPLMYIYHSNNTTMCNNLEII